MKLRCWKQKSKINAFEFQKFHALLYCESLIKIFSSWTSKHYLYNQSITAIKVIPELFVNPLITIRFLRTISRIEINFLLGHRHRNTNSKFLLKILEKENYLNTSIQIGIASFGSCGGLCAISIEMKYLYLTEGRKILLHSHLRHSFIFPDPLYFCFPKCIFAAGTRSVDGGSFQCCYRARWRIDVPHF